MASKLLDEDASMDEILTSIERIVASPSDPPPPRRRWWQRLADRLFPIRRRLIALETEVRRIGSAVDTLAAAAEDAERGKGRTLTQAEIDSLLSDTGWVLGVRPARYAVTQAMERAAGYLDDLPTAETLRILARVRDEEGEEAFVEALFLTLTLSGRDLTPAVVQRFPEAMLELLPRYAARRTIPRDAAERFAARLQVHLDETFVLVPRAALVADALRALPTAAERSAAYRRLLESDADGPPPAEIAALLLDFTDFVAVEAEAVRRTLDGLPGERIGMALMGTPDGVRDAILAALDEETAEAARAWLAAPGSMRLSDPQRARTEILGRARDLVRQGAISWPLFVGAMADNEGA